jgi:hypothetical protein
MKATGYDESLRNSRAGVDANGVDQLLSLGLKQKVIGHHLHFDHPESITRNANQESHGDMKVLASLGNVPYKNPSNWGMEDYKLKEVSKNVWELQRI